MPDQLQNVPLEYFEKVLNWIQENPQINADGIYLHGTSKGGELVLLLASLYSQFKKVVANMPYEGLNEMRASGASSWSFRGEPLPYIELDNSVFLPKCSAVWHKMNPLA